MSTDIILYKFTPKAIVTDPEGNTLTGDQHTFTETPQVRNAVRFMPRVTPPSDRNSLKEGSLYFDDGGKQFYYYDGASWLPLIQPVSGTPLYSPSISNRITRFNGTAGAIKDSLVSLDDLGNIAGVNNLTTTGAFTAVNATITTSLVTPSISSPGTGVNFNNKNLTNLGTVSATDGTFSGTVSTSSLTSPTTDINLNAKNVTNAAAITGTTGTFSTSLSTPSITTAGTGINFNSKNITSAGTVGGTDATFSSSVTTPVLSSTGTDINVSAKNLTNVAGVTGTTGTFSTSLSTPSITSPTFQIGFNSKEINTIQNVSSDQYSSGPSAGDIKLLSATTFVDFTSAANLKNLDTIVYSGTTATMTGIKAITNASSILALNGVQSITATSGDMTITGAPASLIKLSGPVYTDAGITCLNSGISTPSLTATTQVATNTITTNGGASISFNSKDLTSVGNITSTATIQGGTVQGTTIKGKYGDSVYYFAPIVWLNYQNSSTSFPVGITTFKSKSMPAGFMGTDGDGFEITVTGSIVSNANQKQINLTLGGTNIFTGTAQNNQSGMFTLFLTLYRTSSTTVSAGGYFLHANVNQSVSVIGLTVPTLTSAQTWAVTGTLVTQANDMTIRSVKMVFHPSQSS